MAEVVLESSHATLTPAGREGGGGGERIVGRGGE